MGPPGLETGCRVYTIDDGRQVTPSTGVVGRGWRTRVEDGEGVVVGNLKRPGQ